MPPRLARAVSILGHPLLTLPLALLAPLAARQAPGTAPALGGIAAAAAAVLGWTQWRVRRGAWAHVDASAPEERRGLNRFLLPLLAAGALLALGSPVPGLAARLALAAGIVAAAVLAARWCKLSLHVAFAVYAGLLLAAWRPGAGLAMLAFAAAVAASRLGLRRHAPRDLAAGALAGLAAGLAAWALPPPGGA
ncbi:hypothetical protein LDO32_17555 [Luteimonas sp. Y-2-2-4F]|nr:hypothetical protein [Luteimonas sp. Y-2-2-4F]MCD9033522.1 hypothetical protein [Luteimonas sp. Y-2-2-4F]